MDEPRPTIAERFFQEPPAPGPLNALAYAIHKHNMEVGWWDGAEQYSGEILDKHLIPTKLALVHSELSEALEGFRKALMDDHLPHRSMFEVELADTLIRIFDIAGYFNLDLDSAVAEKRAYNSTRADHTREAREAPGGKSV